MLEQKIRFKQAIETRQPIWRVTQFYEEYVEAYKRVHKPSQKHIEDYEKLSKMHEEYKERRSI